VKPKPFGADIEPKRHSFDNAQVTRPSPVL
jgi:hypothetical protein